MITLLLGGARSGKSELAERLAAELPDPVTFVATAHPGDDLDFARRIERHKARRPTDWTTLEAVTDLPAALRGLNGTVLIDSLGTWVASARDFEVDPEDLCSALSGLAGYVFVVSEEVGMGVHPATEAGRRFRDALGALNTRVAALADDAYLVVAGRTLRLENTTRSPVSAE
jgi:adenosyl cobinamide kinase/adenosyl cobinamide phosphate guanylyltransferase